MNEIIVSFTKPKQLQEGLIANFFSILYPLFPWLAFINKCELQMMLMLLRSSENDYFTNWNFQSDSPQDKSKLCSYQNKYKNSN